MPQIVVLGRKDDRGPAARIFGIALGEEARSKGAQLLLAPTINIHRSPLAGRNFVHVVEERELSPDSLSQAIDARKLVGQAQGILMERYDLDDRQAFDVLRRASQRLNRKVALKSVLSPRERIAEYLSMTPHDGPLLVMDLNVVRSNYREFRTALPEARGAAASQRSPRA